MRVSITVILIVFLFLLACGPITKQNGGDKTSAKSTIATSEYITKSGKLFIVTVDHSMGASICNVQIKTSGFSADNSTYHLDAIDPLKDIFLADLDNNGYEEIYLLTESAGSGSYSSVYGFASNKDKSVTPIYVRPKTELQKGKREMFEGFVGHNQFEIQNGKLLNSFPVYLEGDANSKPGGGQRIVQYRLIAGEAGWVLEAEKIIKEEQ